VEGARHPVRGGRGGGMNAAVLRSLQVDFIYFQFPWGRRLDIVVVVVFATTATD